MPVKMTGAQYKAFLSSEWGPDAYWEDTEVLKNGDAVDPEFDSDPSFFSDADTVTIVGGTIIPDQRLSLTQQMPVDAVKFARKWLKAQTTVTLMVEVPRQHVEWFKTTIAGMGVNHEMAKVREVVG